MKQSISLFLVSFLFPSCIGMNPMIDLSYLTAVSFIIFIGLMFGVIAVIDWFKRKIKEFNLKTDKWKKE